REGEKAITQRAAEKATQVGPEGAHDPAVDHVQAPQEQRDAAYEIKKNHASHTKHPPTVGHGPAIARPIYIDTGLRFREWLAELRRTIESFRAFVAGKVLSGHLREVATRGRPVGAVGHIQAHDL
ncbi:MAG: hypothetical protein JWO52_6703, partial [Gammaproteobacteria bacterium]|nr:hypothetical protein [Gammaproteobacteria bacterium]